MKDYADVKHHSNVSYIEGDDAIVKQAKLNKLTPTFGDKLYKVVERKGSAVYIEIKDRNTYLRNILHVKKFDPSTEEELIDLTTETSNAEAETVDAG